MEQKQTAAVIQVMNVLRSQLKGMWLAMANATTTYEDYDEVIRNIHWQLHKSSVAKGESFASPVNKTVNDSFTFDVIKAVNDYVNKF